MVGYRESDWGTDMGLRQTIHRVKHIMVLAVLGSSAALLAKPAAAPPASGLKPDIVYKTSAEGDLLLDLYYPAGKREGIYPVVVYVHGGGWAVQDRKKATRGGMARVVRGLNKAGFCVASVDYRLCNNEKTKIRDCVTDSIDAVRYLAKHSKALHIDPTRVFSFGESAGGQLAQMLLLAPPEAFPGAAELAGQRYTMVAGVSWFGPCDFERMELFSADGRSKARDRFGGRIVKPGISAADKLRLYREVSPVTYLRTSSPSLLMIQGDKDGTIPVHHAYYMQEKAKACAAPVEILIVKNAGHNWRMADGKTPIEPPLIDIVQRTVDFLVSELSRETKETSH